MIKCSDCWSAKAKFVPHEICKNAFTCVKTSENNLELKKITV